MKLKPYASNMTIVEMNSNIDVLFSYSTPVAAYVLGKGYCRTDKWFSQTTSRHINKWLRDEGILDVDEVQQKPQEYFDNLVTQENF